jgi:DHA1 family multidrug resistance protein-like MFS transporter
MPPVPRPLRDLFSGLPREVAILSSVSFTVALGYGIVAPCIPVFARQFGVSPAAAASVISAFALMRIVFALPAGRLVDRFGEHKTMAAGIAIVAVSSVLAGFSGSFAQLIMLRGAGGLGSALFSVSAQTLLLRSVPGGLRGRASGLYTGGFLLGGISGPAVGGLVAAWSLRAPFFIYGAMLVVPAGIAAVVLRDSARADAGTPARAAGSFREIGRALRSSAYRAAAAANLADGFAVMGVRSAILPLFVVVAAVNAATLLPAGRVADTLGRRPVVVAGCAIAGGSMVMLAVLPGIWGYLTALAVLGLGSGMLDVAPSAMVGDIIGGQAGQPGRPALGGSAVASFQMAGDIGTVAGPVAVGALFAMSYQASFLVAAGVLGLAALAGLAAAETRPAAAEGPAGPAEPAGPATALLPRDSLTQ